MSDHRLTRYTALPGERWPGYFTRTLLHRVEPTNARRISGTLGLADCGAVAIRPSLACDYHWCTLCTDCFPTPAESSSTV